MSDCTLFFFLVQKPPSHCQPKCLPVEVTRTISRKSFLNKFTIIRPPNQWIATRTGRRKIMLLPKGWKLTEVSLLVSFTMKFIYSWSKIQAYSPCLMRKIIILMDPANDDDQSAPGQIIIFLIPHREYARILDQV